MNLIARQRPTNLKSKIYNENIDLICSSALEKHENNLTLKHLNPIIPVERIILDKKCNLI